MSQRNSVSSGSQDPVLPAYILILAGPLDIFCAVAALRQEGHPERHGLTPSGDGKHNSIQTVGSRILYRVLVFCSAFPPVPDRRDRFLL